MSERMIPIPFRELMTWIVTEYGREGSVFGVPRPYRAGEKHLPIFGGERLETPFGPAAGPNTQLAQNIVAAYFAGARFFELKTVQKMDGAELAACISRPCILAEDECYNCEWSTELYVQQAFEEYVKAWCACKIMAKVYGLGDPDAFVFNMSVGYDLEGIQGPKVDKFLTEMVDASKTPIFQECIRVLKEFFPGESAFIDGISPRVSGSVTVSTLHGCPPDEIERIASYLITEKGLHTFVKCNPTILGYESARSILDGMGYGYIAFDEHHFNEDLQYTDAIPMFRRLLALAGEKGLEFGLKLSNTFPVDVKQNELPSEEMYMAGKSLFPLTIEMARRVSREFGGRLRLSYSGGADFFNIDKLFQCGIWPITMATTELKPGGYQRFKQIGEKLEALKFEPFTAVDTEKVEALALAIRSDKYHVKAVKPLPRRKLYEKVPLIDCFTAPCKGGCPIGQDIPEYIELCRQGKYAQALQVILEKNPLPFITGTICAHHCMDKCTRNFYERSVQIRATKLVAAERGYDQVLPLLKPAAPVTDGRKAAVVGGGPTGMAAAYFCARGGIPTTIFEKEAALGGVVRQNIPVYPNQQLLAEGVRHPGRAELRGAEGLLQALDGPHVLQSPLRARPQEVEAPPPDGVKAGVQGLLRAAAGPHPLPAQPDHHPLIGLRGVDDGPVNQIVLDQQDVPGLEEVGDALHQIGRFPPQEEDELVEFVIVIVHLLGPAVLQVEEAEVLIQIAPLAGGLPDGHDGFLPPGL